MEHPKIHHSYMLVISLFVVSLLFLSHSIVKFVEGDFRLMEEYNKL